MAKTASKVAAADRNAALLDRVFRDPGVRHGTKIFSADELNELDLVEDAGKVYVACYLTGKKRLAKPEEIIRQLSLHQLIDDLHYPQGHIDVEVPVKMGSAYASKKADIVVYKEDAKQTPHIIVEVKKPRRKDGLSQLHSYMNATGVYYGAWINGNDAVYQLRDKPNFFERLFE